MEQLQFTGPSSGRRLQKAGSRSGTKLDWIDNWHRTVLPTVTRETQYAGTGAYVRPADNA